MTKVISTIYYVLNLSAVKLGDKERFDKEQIGIKEPFPVTNLPFTSEGYGTFGIKEQFQGDQKVPYCQVRLYRDNQTDGPNTEFSGAR